MDELLAMRPRFGSVRYAIKLCYCLLLYYIPGWREGEEEGGFCGWCLKREQNHIGKYLFHMSLLASLYTYLDGGSRLLDKTRQHLLLKLGIMGNI